MSDITEALIKIKNHTGLNLSECPYFNGIRFLNDKPYFNVETNISENHHIIRQLERSNIIDSVLENGVSRLAIFMKGGLS